MGIFITGGTGFVGTEVISVLLRTSQETLYCLVRAGGKRRPLAG